MSEWWTYRLSDFLMFAPRTYYRLFELYNKEVWPLQLLALALGLAVVCLVRRGGAAGGRIGLIIAAIASLFVAWAYHWQRYATINWAAAYYAAGFALEGLMLMAVAAFARKVRDEPSARALDTFAPALVVVGVVMCPLIAPLAGRGWTQAELFGIAPDPTAIATLGVALPISGRLAMLLVPLPLLWCAISAATLWTMESLEAAVPAAAGILAMLAAAWKAWEAEMRSVVSARDAQGPRR